MIDWSVLLNWQGFWMPLVVFYFIPLGILIAISRWIMRRRKRSNAGEV